MKCFYHQTVDAVGSCKSCLKGLCPECAVDLGKGLACRGRCESEVERVTALIDRNIRLSPTGEQLIQANKQGMLLSALFVLAVGAAFLALGLFNRGAFGFEWFIGGVFVVYGAFQIMRYRRVSRARG